MRLGLGLGLRDYVTKNGFGDVVIAISGGIDSALTAAIAADALGAARVHTVSMPSRFSSEGTRDDAREVSENLGVDFREVPIEAIVGTYHAALGGLEGLAAENLQARIRGTMLMALSNTHGWLVLATGNKSEMAVGYATIYGDMVGGYALLKDVFKTDVWRLSRHLNERAGRELIPVTTIERPPSAELRDDQRDDQSLPPYDVLDPLLEAYVELDRSREELEAQFDPAIVERTLAARRPRRVQAPPGGTRREAPPARVRTRLADADHQQVEGLRRGFSSPRFLLAQQSSASAATVRQFRAVTIVGSERLVSASMNFDRPWPFGTLT